MSWIRVEENLHFRVTTQHLPAHGPACQCLALAKRAAKCIIPLGLLSSLSLHCPADADHLAISVVQPLAVNAAQIVNQSHNTSQYCAGNHPHDSHTSLDPSTVRAPCAQTPSLAEYSLLHKANSHQNLQLWNKPALRYDSEWESGWGFGQKI